MESILFSLYTIAGNIFALEQVLTVKPTMVASSGAFGTTNEANIMLITVLCRCTWYHNDIFKEVFLFCLSYLETDWLYFCFLPSSILALYSFSA